MTKILNHTTTTIEPFNMSTSLQNPADTLITSASLEELHAYLYKVLSRLRFLDRNDPRRTESGLQLEYQTSAFHNVTRSLSQPVEDLQFYKTERTSKDQFSISKSFTYNAMVDAIKTIKKIAMEASDHAQKHVVEDFQDIANRLKLLASQAKLFESGLEIRHRLYLMQSDVISIG